MPLDKNAPLGHYVPMLTVVEIPHYERRAAKLLSVEEREGIIMMVAADPLAGDIITGTGGVRKIRFGKGNRGKSGGVRVAYYYYDESAPVFLLEAFGKNEKPNLTKAERNGLAKFVAELKKELRRK